MLLTRIGLTGWVLANVLASAVFIHFASWTWLNPNLRGRDVAVTGDAFVWMLGAAPILIVTAAVNVLWLMFASIERRRSAGAWPASNITVVAAIWICALMVDHLRGMGF